MVGKRRVRIVEKLSTRSLPIAVGTTELSTPSLYAEVEERVEKTVPARLLEEIYHRDSLTFRLVQDYVDFLVSPGFYLEGEEQDLIDRLNRWIKEVDLESILPEIVKDILVSGAGNAYVELGYDETTGEIVKLRILNPKTIDFIRDSLTGSILLEPDGSPVGYKMETSSGTKIEWRKDQIIKNGEVVWRRIREDEDGRDRIAHFKLFGLGESLLGMTPLEPCYKQVLIRLNLEEAVGESSSRSGGIVLHVGRPDQPLESISKEDLKKVTDMVRNVVHRNILAFRRDEVEISRFPTPDLRNSADLIYTFADFEATAFGRGLINVMHSTLRRGYTGEAQQKAIEWEIRVKSLQKILARQIRDKILKRVVKSWKLDPRNTPNVVFRSVLPATLRDRARAVATLARHNLLKYDPAIAERLAQEYSLPTEFIQLEKERWKNRYSKLEESDLDESSS